ncbi:hypothetical protein CLOM_g2131 [Closterium sp. NIES-68]|nr:hypothetical protein CLOM_g2131 [Closterium sp. NIES-68]
MTATIATVVSAKAACLPTPVPKLFRVNLNTSLAAVPLPERTRRPSFVSRFSRRQQAQPCRAAASDKEGRLPPSPAIARSVSAAASADSSSAGSAEAGTTLLAETDQQKLVSDVAWLLSRPRSYYYREHHHEQQHERHGLFSALRKSEEQAQAAGNGAAGSNDDERAAAASVKEGTTIGEVAAMELVRQLDPQGRQVLLTALFPGADNSEAEEEFEHADAHHDGVISEGEFEQYVDEQQAKIDALHQPLDMKQLALLARKELIGNMGFGITKNTVMIISGDLIASTLGAAFGFSTLMAAGLGNAVADVVGTWCREGIEASS